MFTCFVSGVPAAYISPSSPAAAHTKKKPWTLIEEIVTAPVLLISCFPHASFAPWPASCGPWTEGHVGCTVSFYFFPLPFPQRTMTLKSNKNEPAVTLESVNSVRTALSDLYLEQLIQNKPKSDKVRCLFLLVIFFFCTFFSCPYSNILCACLLPGFSYAPLDRCLFRGYMSKNRLSVCFHWQNSLQVNVRTEAS